MAKQVQLAKVFIPCAGKKFGKMQLGRSKGALGGGTDQGGGKRNLTDGYEMGRCSQAMKWEDAFSQRYLLYRNPLSRYEATI